jgi:hypothetical protein
LGLFDNPSLFIPLPFLRGEGVIFKRGEASFKLSLIFLGCLRGVVAPLLISSPSPLKERGIKGVRMITI